MFKLLCLQIVLAVIVKSSSSETSAAMVRVGRTYRKTDSPPARGDPFDCSKYPLEEIVQKYEVTNTLTISLAKQASEDTFDQHPYLETTAVWQGPTTSKFGKWRNSRRYGPTCTTEVQKLYEVKRFKPTPTLIGQDCKIYVEKKTSNYLPHLTVCKKNAKFVSNHHCSFCEIGYLKDDIPEWQRSQRLQNNQLSYPYILIGPIEDFYFYGEEKTFATHSRMMVAFAAEDATYFYTNARLIFNGRNGDIYKLDLSHNSHYNQGPNLGIFEPGNPPGYENVIPYVPHSVPSNL